MSYIISNTWKAKIDVSESKQGFDYVTFAVFSCGITVVTFYSYTGSFTAHESN